MLERSDSLSDLGTCTVYRSFLWFKKKKKKIADSSKSGQTGISEQALFLELSLFFLMLLILILLLFDMIIKILEYWYLKIMKKIFKKEER